MLACTVGSLSVLPAVIFTWIFLSSQNPLGPAWLDFRSRRRCAKLNLSPYGFISPIHIAALPRLTESISLAADIPISAALLALAITCWWLTARFQMEISWQSLQPAGRGVSLATNPRRHLCLWHSSCLEQTLFCLRQLHKAGRA